MQLSLAGARNFRGVHGLVLRDGRRLRRNLLLRSAHLNRLTPQDWSALRSAGLRSICDLRGAEERLAAPTPVPDDYSDVRVLNFDIRNDVRSDSTLAALLASDPTPAGARRLMLQIYRQFPDAFATKLRAFFALFGGGQGPALVHCTAGKDRTGFLVGLWLHALGATREQILEDYLLSGTRDGLGDRRLPGLQAMFRERTGITVELAALLPILQVSADYLDAAFNSVIATHGSLDRYLHTFAGMDAAARRRFQEACLG